MASDPAQGLLLAIGLIQFWLVPAIAWALLRGQGDSAARCWFAGTAVYALAATAFMVQAIHPGRLAAVISLGLVSLTISLFAESLRQELDPGPAPKGAIASLVGAHMVLLAEVERIAGVDAMRVAQLLVVSLLDAGCCVLVLRVIGRHSSRSLVFVLIGFVVVILSNIFRVGGYLCCDLSTRLLAYNATSNIAFVVNYVSVIVYTFGYGGFVLEKSRGKLVSEMAARNRAEGDRNRALDREKSTADLVRQRDELIGRLAFMQQAAQAGALSASLAHEINQPLATVRLYADEAIALQRAGGSPDRLATALATIAAENLRAARIVRTLRDLFTRRSSSPSPHTVDQAVEDMCALVARRARDVGVAIRIELGAPCRVRSGAGELEHVVLNLLGNAIDVLARSECKTPLVVVTSGRDRTHAWVNIRDNGPGVDVEARQTIFDIFSGSNTSGLGFGLWLSKYIVDLSGGAIELEDAKRGGGASFTVRLPLFADSDETSASR